LPIGTFQSLLSWIRLLNIKEQAVLAQARVDLILVVMDPAPQHGASMYAALRAKMHRSVLCSLLLASASLQAGRSQSFTKSRLVFLYRLFSFSLVSVSPLHPYLRWVRASLFHVSFLFFRYSPPFPTAGGSDHDAPLEVSILVVLDSAPQLRWRSRMTLCEMAF